MKYEDWRMLLQCLYILGHFPAPILVIFPAPIKEQILISNHLMHNDDVAKFGLLCQCLQVERYVRPIQVFAKTFKLHILLFHITGDIE